MSQGYYYGGANRARANDIYGDIAVGTYGFAGQDDPFVDPYNTTVGGGSGMLGEFGSVIMDYVTRSMLGMRNPFRIPSWNEPNAGELGAYAYGRFSDNAKRMGGAVRNSRLQSRKAFGKVLTGLARRAAGNDSARQAELDELEKSVLNDESGLSDTAISIFQGIFGVEDYGLEGIRAAQRSEALTMSRLSPESRSIMMQDRNVLSNTWSDRASGVVNDYTRAARASMYKGDTFIRNEDFMRGFSISDVSSVLEQVAASAGAGEDLGARFETVGKQAIKTLEAFRDLFGSADAAKRMLNQITGGGWSNMSADALQRVVNQTRGLQALGQMNGLDHQVVGNMLATGMAGVQQAMGYSPADVAGGYVNTPTVQGISQRFLANELANMQDGGAGLNPVQVQRLKARANWRAIEFAGSSANKAMTAFEYAMMKGVIARDSTTAHRIGQLFSSGDQRSMSMAVSMVADAMGLTREDIFNDTTYKMFADAVGNDPEALNDLLDRGLQASAREDRSIMERTIANTGLDMATNMAKDAGYKSEDIKQKANQAKFAEIQKALHDHAGQIAGAGALEEYMLKAMQEHKDDKDGGVGAALRVFEEMSGNLGDSDFVTMLRTNATAAAADAVTNEFANRKLDSKTALTNEDRIKEIIESHGGDASDGIRAADARKVLTQLRDSGLTKVDAKTAKIVQDALRDGSDEAVVNALNELSADGGVLTSDDTVALVYTNSTFTRPDIHTARSSTKTARMIADEIRASETGISVDRRYYAGAGHLDENQRGLVFEGGEAIIDTLVGLAEDEQAFGDKYFKDKKYDSVKDAEYEKYKAKRDELKAEGKTDEEIKELGFGDTKEEWSAKYDADQTNKRKEKAAEFKAKLEGVRKKFEEAKNATGPDRDEKMQEAYRELGELTGPNSEYADVFADNQVNEKLDTALSALEIEDENGEKKKVFSGTDARTLIKVMGSETAFQDVVTIGDRSYNRATVDTMFSEAAKKAAEGAEEGSALAALSGLSGEDLYKAVAALGDEDKEKFLSALETVGGTALAASDADMGGVVETVATANAADSGFGGAMVAANKLSGSLKSLDKRVLSTGEYLEMLGKHIQAMVDENAPAAYMTMSQAVISGLTTGNLDEAIDMMFKPGTTDEEKAAGIAKVKGILTKFGILDEEGNVSEDWKDKIVDNEEAITNELNAVAGGKDVPGKGSTPTVAGGAEAPVEGGSMSENAEIIREESATATAGKHVGSTEEAAKTEEQRGTGGSYKLDDVNVKQGESEQASIGSSSDNPIFVSIVPGCSVEVSDSSSAPAVNPSL